MTFNHKKIDHPLVNMDKMPKEALAQITEESLESFSEMWDEYHTLQKEDVTTAMDIANRINDDCKTLFGSYSKQHKYMERNLRGREDVVSIHGGTIPSKEAVTNAVTEAKKSVDITNLHAGNTGGSVDDITMEQQNKAIAFLLSNKYVFGIDFTAYNAHEIAVSLAFDKAIQLGDDIEFEREATPSFSECEGCETKKISFVPKDYLQNKTITCSCCCLQYNAKLVFDGSSVKVMISGGE
jgi:hypothetical protein